MSGEDKKDTLKSSLNMNNPNSYYLTSVNHSRNVISPVILNGESYANWVRILTYALKSKHKYRIVDETLAKLASDSLEVHAWEKNNVMVVAWLYNIIDKTLHGSVAYAETESEIWTFLKERYSQSNEIRIHQVKQEITLTKQGILFVT